MEATEHEAFLMRSEALDRAIRVMAPSGDPGAVLDAARSFLAFLKNEDNPNASAVEEAKTW